MRVNFDTRKWIAVLSEFSGSEVKALLAMSLLSDGHPERVEFRTEDMCRVSGLTRMTFQKALHGMEKRNIIQIIQCNSGAQGTTIVSIPKAWLSVSE